MNQEESRHLRLTSRGKYAMMAMIELALHESRNPISLTIIAQKGDLSLSYLEQLFAGLRRHGLVKSHRGPGGGYRLGRAAHSISIAEILRAAEDSVPAKRTEYEGNRDDRYGNEQTRNLWIDIGEILEAVLSKISLEDAAAKRAKANPHILKLFETLE